MRSFPSRARSIVSLTTALGLGALSVAIAVPASATSSGFDPMAANGGFTVVARGDALMSGGELEGSLAVGGDVAFTGSYPLIHSSGLTPTSYAVPVVAGDPTRLLVGGTFDHADSSGVTEVSSRGGQPGIVKLGRLGSGLSLSPRGSGWTWFGPGPAAEPAISSVHQPFGSPDAVSLGAYSAYFGSVDAAGDVESIRQLASLRSGKDARAVAVEPARGTHAGAVKLSLTEGVVNVVEVAETDTAFLGDADRVVQLAGATLSARTTLVVSVLPGTPRSGSIVLPRFELANNSSAVNANTVAPYTLWDLTALGARPITVAGSKISGAIFAPAADLTLAASTSTEGQVRAGVLTVKGGEIHHYGFTCDTPTPASTPTPTPTPSPTPTVSPSPTPTAEPVPTAIPTPTATPTVVPTPTPTPSPAPTPTATPTVVPAPTLEPGPGPEPAPSEPAPVVVPEPETTSPAVVPEPEKTAPVEEDASPEPGGQDASQPEPTRPADVGDTPAPVTSVPVDTTKEPTATPTRSEVLAATPAPTPSPTYTSDVLAAGPTTVAGKVLAATGSPVGAILGGSAVLLISGATLFLLYRRRSLGSND